MFWCVWMIVVGNIHRIDSELMTLEVRHSHHRNNSKLILTKDYQPIKRHTMLWNRPKKMEFATTATLQRRIRYRRKAAILLTGTCLVRKFFTIVDVHHTVRKLMTLYSYITWCLTYACTKKNRLRLFGLNVNRKDVNATLRPHTVVTSLFVPK